MYIEPFPDSFINLQIEVLLPDHAKLQAILNAQPDKDTMVLFAEIAAYLEIMLDGDYLPTDLATLFTKKLKEKRQGNAGTAFIMPETYDHSPVVE